MPISPLQFRERIGKYQRKNLLTTNNPISSVNFKDATKLDEITKIAANHFSYINSSTSFETTPFLHISLKNQSAVKTSLVLMMFLQQTNVFSGKLFVKDSNFTNSFPKERDTNLKIKSYSDGFTTSSTIEEFTKIPKKIFPTLPNAPFLIAETSNVPNSSSIYQPVHNTTRYKTDYFNDAIFVQVNKKLCRFLKKKGILQEKSKDKITKEELIASVLEYSVLDFHNIKIIAKKIFSVFRLYHAQKKTPYR